jgi:2-C-methyl-D-erythritol 4-phosphate cytidylyltransferase
VHDAARPFLSLEVLEKALNLALKFDNVVTAVSIKDSIFKAGEFVQDYLEREDVYYAQTPQIFRYETLKRAFEKAILENFIGTDESMLVKRIGQKVYLSEGSLKNFKITTNEDLEFAKEILLK